MKAGLIHYVNVDENTSFNKINIKLLTEKNYNNFFYRAINYFNLLKQECPYSVDNAFHFFIPLHHADENRMLEKLTDSKSKNKRLITMNFHINNSFQFSLFREYYKDFLVQVNGKSFFDNYEIFMLENLVPWSEIRECNLMCDDRTHEMKEIEIK